MENYGIIMLRHVNNKLTNNYWQTSYKCIRKFYPNIKIVIIDDNSNYKFITKMPLVDCLVIQSEFPKRGELLPYLYFLKFKFFQKAIIIHDSVFINKNINFNVNRYRFIWDFDHTWNNRDDEIRLLKIYNDPKLIEFYNNKHLWKGCFGGMTIIDYDYLVLVDNFYPLYKLLDLVITRENRCSFERVIGCLLCKFCRREPLLGNINKYCKWGGDSRGVGLDKWLWLSDSPKLSQFKKNRHLPIIKIWTGR